MNRRATAVEASRKRRVTAPTPPGVTRLPSDQIRKAAADKKRQKLLMETFHPDNWQKYPEMKDAATAIFQQLSAAQPARSTGTTMS